MTIFSSPEAKAQDEQLSSIFVQSYIETVWMIRSYSECQVLSELKYPDKYFFYVLTKTYVAGTH